MIFHLENDNRVISSSLSPEFRSISLRPTSNIEISLNRTRIYLYNYHSSSLAIICRDSKSAMSLFEELDLALTYDKINNPQVFI